MFKTADNSIDNKIDLGDPQSVNLDTVNEKTKTKPTEPDIDLDEFFAGMDKKFNGAIYNEEVVTPTEDTTKPVIEDSSTTSLPAPSDEVVRLEKELGELKQRYSSSSREATRLAEENKRLGEYSDYLPIMDTMREDPGLINHVRNYLEGNAAPKSIKEELNLPEDFFFDNDEAISNPNSNSARVFQTMIDKGVAKQFAEQNRANTERGRVATAKQTQEREFEAFRQDTEMSDEDFNSFIDYAKNTKLTLKDIHYLMDRKNREREIAKKAIEEQSNKLKKMRSQPASLASAGSISDPVTEERMVFDAIKNASQTANIFEEGE